MNYSAMQEEHKAWLEREFPNQPVWLPAAGMVEEAGELLSVLIKSKRIEEFGPDRRYVGRDWRVELIDAVGDCAIYCCSLCNTVGWDFARIAGPASADPEPQALAPIALAAELVRCATSLVVQPLQLHAIMYVSLLKTLCASLELNFGQVVQCTWESVKERRRCG